MKVQLGFIQMDGGFVQCIMMYSKYETLSPHSLL